jgi:hypothetical protein
VKDHQSVCDGIGVLKGRDLQHHKRLEYDIVHKHVLVLLATTSVGCLHLQFTGKIRWAYVDAGVLPLRESDSFQSV